MKIGILTQPLHTNYGGILQAYALQTVLERMGHDVEVIAPPQTPLLLAWWKRPLSMAKRLALRCLLGRKDVVIDVNACAKERYRRLIPSQKYTRQFIDAHIHRRVVERLEDIRPDDYEAIVVGSDQIWRKSYSMLWKEQTYADVFLAFTEGWPIRRIAYAPSFGVDHIEAKGKEIEACRKAVAQFDAVSVREESGVEICRRALGIDAKCVLDPTLLLRKEDYESLIPDNGDATRAPFLLSYILDETDGKDALRRAIAEGKGLDINITNKADNQKKDEPVKPQPPVEDWLRAFAKADYVITDSFHACVFSILFHRQFTVVGNDERGNTRIKSLLRMLGLQGRMVTATGGGYTALPDIDYAKVDAVLEEKRKASYGFLADSLGKTDGDN